MLYCVVMAIKPMYRIYKDMKEEYFWTKNKYAAVKFFQCQLEKNTDSYTNAFTYGSMYCDVDFRVISDEKVAKDIMENNPNNIIKIFQNHNKTVSVVITARMYFHIISGKYILKDSAAEFSEDIVSTALRNLIYAQHFLKDGAFKNAMRKICMYDFKNCETDPISRALSDASSWLHYYVI